MGAEETNALAQALKRIDKKRAAEVEREAKLMQSDWQEQQRQMAFGVDTTAYMA